MQIHGPTSVHGPQPINAPHRVKTAEPPCEAGRVNQTDQLDISPEADMVSRVRDMPDVRGDRVAEIRQAIQNGTYETEEKMGMALDRLLDDLA